MPEGRLGMFAEGFPALKAGRIPFNVGNKTNRPRPKFFPYPDEDAQSAIDRMTNLSKMRADMIYHFIVALKGDLGIKSLTDMFDGLYLFATDTSSNALVNLAQNQYNLTAVNNPTFTTDVGFTGTGSSYLNTNFNATTASGANFISNNCGLGLYVNNTVLLSQGDCGVGDNLGNGVFLNSSTGAGNAGTATLSMQNNFVLPPTNSLFTNKGLYAMNRVDANGFDVTLGGIVYQGHFIQASIALVNATLTVMTWNGTGGVFGHFSTKTFSAFYFGSGSIPSHLVNQRLQEYLIPLGAAV